MKINKSKIFKLYNLIQKKNNDYEIEIINDNILDDIKIMKLSKSF